jgi:hypothetical protein
MISKLPTREKKDEERGKGERSANIKGCFDEI